MAWVKTTSTSLEEKLSLALIQSDPAFFGIFRFFSVLEFGSYGR